MTLPHPMQRVTRLVRQASVGQSHHDEVEILLDGSGDVIVLGSVVLHEFRSREGDISLRGELLGPKESLRRQLTATDGFLVRFSNGRESSAVLEGETLVVMGDNPFA